MEHTADQCADARRPPLVASRISDRLGSERWQVRTVDAIGSTNAELLAAGRPWQILATDNQTAGRGRVDRGWSTPPGLGIAVSFSLPLPAEGGAWGWVPLLVGTAVRQALADHTGAQVTLKWPNDVLARSASEPGNTAEWGKICGVLCQTTRDAAHAALVICGTGINIDQREADLPTRPGALPATSAALLGATEIDREALIADIAGYLARIEEHWADPLWIPDLTESYRDHCVTIGQHVSVTLPTGERVSGVADTVDSQGRLVVTTELGPQAFAVGDIEHVRGTQARDMQAGDTQASGTQARGTDG